MQLDGTVSLDWKAVEDPRVTGYMVFRGSAAGGPFLQVDADLVTTPHLLAGANYFTIVAVTGSGVESVSSPALAVALPGL